MSGFKAALAGAAVGIGEGLVQRALAEREESRERLRMAFRATDREDSQEFQRDERIAGEASADRRAMLAASAKPRMTKRDVNGVERYVDDGSPVFEGVEKSSDGPTFRPANAEEVDKFGVPGQVDDSTGRFYPVSPPKGSRIEVGPDGQVLIEEGSDVTGGGAKLGRAGMNEVDSLAINASKSLARLDRIDAAISDNPEILESLTLSGNLKRMGLEWGDFISPESLSDEQAQYLYKVTQLRADVLDNLNYTIKEITGAAMTEPEAVRIGGTMPLATDSPGKFMSKLRGAQNRVRAAVARYNLWQKNGSIGEATDYDTLGNIESQMEKRRAELWREVKSNNLSADEASAMFYSEYGV